MNFGKNKRSTKSVTEMQVDMAGINVYEELRTEDVIFDKIMNVIDEERDNSKIVPSEPEQPDKEKIYLNTAINLLFNKLITPVKKTKQKIISKIVKWNRKETVNDFTDLVKFILIHGGLGATTTLALLTLTNIDVTLIQFIRGNLWIALCVYITGSGSAYYLFCDVNKFLHDTWGKRGKR